MEVKRWIQVSVVCAAALTLAGCGGGGGGGDSTPTTPAEPTTPATPTTPTPPATLTVTGTAATGKALAGAAVAVKCASGGSSGTAGPDGRFSIDLGTTATLPCVLRAVSSTTVLHGALGTGTVANITPLTELGLARAAGSTAASLFDNFDAAAQGRVGIAGLASATEALRSALQGRVDLSGIDPFTSPFAVGDSHDLQLEALSASLNKARLEQPNVPALVVLASALVASGATPGTVATLLQPASAGCPGLRSGRYRVVDPNTTDDSNTVATIDAEALSATLPGGTAAVPLTDNRFCSFTFPDTAGTSRMLVSPSGLSVLLRQRSGNATIQTDVSLLVPEQTLPVSELAGTWNELEYSRATATDALATQLRSVSVAADGTVTNVSECKGRDAACKVATGTSAAPWAAHPDGGFVLQKDAATQLRGFAFKSADGHVSLVMRRPANTGMVVAARQEAQTLPAVGNVTAFWDFTVDTSGYLFVGNNGVNTLTSSKVTVTSVDATTQTMTRQRADGRLDQQVLNQPLPGMRIRATNGCSLNGAPATCSGTATLPLPGTGLTVYAGLPPATFLGVSVNQP